MIDWMDSVESFSANFLLPDRHHCITEFGMESVAWLYDDIGKQSQIQA
jgi:hypothetical protein